LFSPSLPSPTTIAFSQLFSSFDGAEVIRLVNALYSKLPNDAMSVIDTLIDDQYKFKYVTTNDVIAAVLVSRAKQVLKLGKASSLQTIVLLQQSFEDLHGT
jgi:hypothetical protein